jgi:hypothetical protein
MMATTTVVEQKSTLKAEAHSPSTYLTIDGLLKSHASDPSDPILIGYPATGVSDFEEFTATDLDRFADAAVARYTDLGLPPAVRHSLFSDLTITNHTSRTLVLMKHLLWPSFHLQESMSLSPSSP